MDMQVEDGLTGRGAAIDTDIIAIRSVILLNDCLRGIHGADKGIPLLSTSLEPRRNMTSRDQERMAGRDRVSVPQTKHLIPAQKNASL